LPMPELAPVTIATLLMGMLLCKTLIVNKLRARASNDCLVRVNSKPMQSR
jgi:hypothetical protein